MVRSAFRGRLVAHVPVAAAAFRARVQVLEQRTVVLEDFVHDLRGRVAHHRLQRQERRQLVADLPLVLVLSAREARQVVAHVAQFDQRHDVRVLGKASAQCTRMSWNCWIQ